MKNLQSKSFQGLNNFHGLDTSLQLAFTVITTEIGSMKKHQSNPSNNRGRLRLEAENRWASIDNLPIHIFRLAGIYGVNRNPLDKIRSGKAQLISKPGQFFSRIHVEDIARVLKASIDMPNYGSIYNVCDDMPAAQDEVLDYAAKLINYPDLPKVVFEEADMTPMARVFMQTTNALRMILLKENLNSL